MPSHLLLKCNASHCNVSCVCGCTYVVSQAMATMLFVYFHFSIEIFISGNCAQSPIITCLLCCTNKISCQHLHHSSSLFPVSVRLSWNQAQTFTMMLNFTVFKNVVRLKCCCSCLHQSSVLPLWSNITFLIV